MLSGVSILIRLIGVSFNAFIAVKVGEECMGLFTLVSSVYGLSVTFATSGVNLAVVSLVSGIIAKAEKRGEGMPSEKLKRAVRAAVLYSLFFGAVTGVVVYAFSDFIGVRLLGDARTVKSLRVFAVSLVPIAVSTVFTGYFTGARRIYKNAVVSLCEQAAKIFVITAGLVLIAPRGIEWACLAIVGGGAASEAASLISSFTLYIFDRTRKNRLAGKDSSNLFSSVKEVASLGIPVALGSYARQGLLTAEHLAIPWGLSRYGLDKSESLSAYGVMHGMVMPLVMFPSAVLYSFAGLLVPELSECRAVGNEKRVISIGEKVFRASLFFSICVAGIFLSFSEVIGISMYQSAEAARQLHLIAALIPVMYLDSAVDGMLKGLGEQVYCMKVNVVDSAMCLVLVFVLVPAFGIDGYIALLIISEMVNASLSIMRLVKVTGLKIRIVKWIVLPFLSVFGATLLTKPFVRLIGVFFDLKNISAAFPIAVCAVFYIVFCCALGVIRFDARRLAGGIIKKRKKRACE